MSPAKTSPAAKPAPKLLSACSLRHSPPFLKATITKATVYWPDGKVQEVVGLEPGAYWDVTEGEAKPKRATAPR